MYMHVEKRLTVWVCQTFKVLPNTVDLQVQDCLQAFTYAMHACIYWYWCSVLGGFITLAGSSSTSLGIGLSKAERGIPDWLWGAVGQRSEHLQLKQEVLHGFDPQWLPTIFSLSAGLLM